MRGSKVVLVGLLASLCFAPSISWSRDYFLTIAGGYAPQGNQASLEANVLFFQRLLSTKQLSGTHKVYFADGFDGGHDLQVLRRKDSLPTPAIKALSDIFRLPTDEELVYRNHQVPNISGGIRSADIREGLKLIGTQLSPGDRLFVYVTAHGGAARGRDSVNTSITCWGNKPLAMTEFSGWLDALPKDITVISVMAQCYCGGFANTIFAAGDEEEGFAENLRCGFFAQQADLPAAGCRPDVENDEEYSSYFWGAFLGSSRTGKAVGAVDCNGDGRVSLAEAHAYAVLASETTDIPLRSSETILRKFSRIAGYELDPRRTRDEETDEANEAATPESEARLVYLTGTVYEIAARGQPEQTRIIVGLAEKLGVPIASEVGEVMKRYESQRDEFRNSRGSRRPRGFSARRKVQAAVIEKWPELEDPKKWPNADVLKPENQAAFLAELEQLEGYADAVKSIEDRAKAREAAIAAELKQVKFRRLIQQLENVVLAQNIAAVAEADVVDHYRKVVAAEEGFLSGN
ncbi:MAG: hypothetical protein SFV81_00815 [Pirellulaceae bacterium]|nr:hypothetical protein [Pirellulaceae bacterium]